MAGWCLLRATQLITYEMKCSVFEPCNSSVAPLITSLARIPWMLHRLLASIFLPLLQDFAGWSHSPTKERWQAELLLGIATGVILAIASLLFLYFLLFLILFLFIYLFCCFFFPVGPQMSVQLEASPDFTAVPVGDDHDSYCLSANGRHTSSWLVTPKSLGEWKFCEGNLPRKGKYREVSSVTFFSLGP